MAYVNTRTACKQLGVHPNTLRKWDKDGKIKMMRTPGGIRLYDLDSLESERPVSFTQGFLHEIKRMILILKSNI